MVRKCETTSDKAVPSSVKVIKDYADESGGKEFERSN